MKNNKIDNKDNYKPTKKNWIAFIIYVILVVILFDYFYDYDTNQDLTVSVGATFFFIIMLYVVNLASEDALNRLLEKPLNVIKRFLSSPIFVIALGTIILLLFLGNVLHFPDII